MGKGLGAAMSSSPWEKLGNGDGDIAAPFRRCLKHGRRRLDEENDNFAISIRRVFSEARLPWWLTGDWGNCCQEHRKRGVVQVTKVGMDPGRRIPYRG